MLLAYLHDVGMKDVIPGELFAREWFRPYEMAEIADVLADVARGGAAERGLA